MTLTQFSLEQIFYCVLYSTISIAAIGGNGIVIFLIVNFRRMQTVTNVFILNLAIGDLLMAILCIPFTFTSNLLLHQWPFGSIMCRVVCFAQAVSVFISAYTLVAISIDRYIAIIYPLRPKMTKRHSHYLIAFIWFVALLTPLPTALLSRLVEQSTLDTLKNQTEELLLNTSNNETLPLPQPPLNSTTPDQLNTTYRHLNLTDWSNSSDPNVPTAILVSVIYFCIEDWSENAYKSYYSVLLMILQYVLPFSVLVLTYSRIAYVVWGKQTPGEAHGGRDARIAASKRKMIKMMITCVAAFTLCWLPFNILIVIGDHYPQIYEYENIEYVWFACHWLAMSHASYNPIIYIWLNARFRYGFRYVLRHCIPCLAGSHDRVREELNGNTVFETRHQRSATKYFYTSYEMTTNKTQVKSDVQLTNCTNHGSGRHLSALYQSGRSKDFDRRRAGSPSCSTGSPPINEPPSSHNSSLD